MIYAPQLFDLKVVKCLEMFSFDSEHICHRGRFEKCCHAPLSDLNFALQKNTNYTSHLPLNYRRKQQN